MRDRPARPDHRAVKNFLPAHPGHHCAKRRERCVQGRGLHCLQRVDEDLENLECLFLISEISRSVMRLPHILDFGSMPRGHKGRTQRNRR